MTVAEMTMDDKITDVFGEKDIVIDKKLSMLSDQFRKLPRFVVDYLITKLVKADDPAKGLAQIDKILQENFVDSDQKELVKSRIRERGVHSLIGHIQCRYDQNKDQYWATIHALDEQYVRIDLGILEKYGDTLLTSGAWGTVEVAFDPHFVIAAKKFPFIIVDFIPLQITKIDLDDWIGSRERFSTSEWIDLLVSSVGFNPDNLTDNEKMLYLMRLIPFIENNINFIELGGAETGKTYAYRSLSSYGFVISGAKTTVASLFYNKLRRKQGILCYKDCVMFDEISHANWSGQDEMVNMLKDFMNDGMFGRDSMQFSSDASIMFAGNIDCDREKREIKGFYRHLFSCLPHVVNSDRAFLDRIHGFIPGWEAPQIKECNYSQGMGFMADYFSEILHLMRDRYYGHVISGRVDFGEMGQRSQNAVTKIASGILKLVFPNRTVETIEDDELKMAVDIGVSLRQRVLDQLAIIAPGEFKDTKLSYTLVQKGD